MLDTHNWLSKFPLRMNKQLVKASAPWSKFEKNLRAGGIHSPSTRPLYVPRSSSANTSDDPRPRTGNIKVVFLDATTKPVEMQK